MGGLAWLFRMCAYDVQYQEIGDSVNYAFTEDGDRLWIWFQGSNSVTDWIRNFFFLPIGKKPYKEMEVPYKVHRGFLSAWKECEDLMIAKITERETGGERRYRYNDITVVGYSHGGSLAFFMCECLWFWRPDLREKGFRVYAFESPRVLSCWRTPKKIKERWANMTVIRDGSDLVTHCPPALFRFCHAGDMLKIKGDADLCPAKNMLKCIKYHYPEVVEDGLKKYEGSEES